MERERFDTSFARTDTVVRRARHGMPWEESELKKLAAMYVQGASLRLMAETLARPADGTINKLRHIGAIEYDSRALCYWKEDASNIAVAYLPPEVIGPFMKKIPSPKEAPMTKIIESRTFIRGQDAAAMSDADIFALIVKLEKEVDGLKAIRASSKKVSAAITSLEEDIAKLVKFVDER